VGSRAVGGGFYSHESPHEQPDAQGASRQRFEYDPAKSASNKEKHGIDFEEAKALWNDDKRVVFDTNHKTELRTVTVADMNGKKYSAVITMRGDTIRIISVRRARKNEVSLYEAQDN
jgi:uncharacterized DUF497 family protein